MQEKSSNNAIRYDWLTLLILVIAAVLVFAPMMHHWRLMGDYGGDANKHNEIAYRLIESPGEFFRNTPHFLYHVLTAGIYWISPDRDIYVAGVRVMVLSYLALITILYWRARSLTQWDHRPIIIASSAVSVFSLALIAPINLFTPDNLYFGYYLPHVYHNPTVQLLKPFALGLFFLTIPLFRSMNRLSWHLLPIYIGMTAASVFAKPNFVLSFVPTLGLITAFYGLRQIAIERRAHPKNTYSPQSILNASQNAPINWILLIGGIVLPTFLILLYQTQTWTSAGGITFDPFRVFYEWTLHYEPNADQNLWFKFLMSTAFPVAVYGLYWRSASKNLALKMAWINFLISVAYAILLVDQSVISAGDFSWGAQIGILILQSTSVFFLLNKIISTAKTQRIAFSDKAIWFTCIAIFILHVLSGIYWYYLHLTQDAISLIYGAW